jgi:probable addiction module antidote protein
MPIETTIFDPAEHLDAEGHAELIVDAFVAGDAAYIKHALNIVARSRGMSHLARSAGVTREALYY